MPWKLALTEVLPPFHTLELPPWKGEWGSSEEDVGVWEADKSVHTSGGVPSLRDLCRARTVARDWPQWPVFSRWSERI